MPFGGKAGILRGMFREGTPEQMLRKVALHVMLRLTRMDVCCGPPATL